MSARQAVPGTVVVPVTDVAAARQAELVNRARAELLRSGTAVTLDEMAAATGRTRAAVSKAVERHRRAGRLIAVVHDRTTLIPTFQLDDALELDPAVSTVVRRLTGAGMTEWAVWRWATTPNSWLFNETPADRIAAGDLDAVQRAADGLLQS